MAAPMKTNLTVCCKSKAFLSSSVSSHFNQCTRTVFGKASRETTDDSYLNEVDSQGFRRYRLKKGGGDGRPVKTKQLTYTQAPVQQPRSTKMPVNQDWTNVWPTAQTFKWSVVPLPIRQGALKSNPSVKTTLGKMIKWSLTAGGLCLQRESEAKGDGFPPDKYGNTELIKIPNFLHLTPKHIEKHCAAIKKFCTPWPKELETEKDMDYHFPIEVITEDFCFSSPSVRDPRARVVTMKFKKSDLELDEHASEKMQRLLQSREDSVELTSDRCPLKQQNYDFLQYLLTALYFESWKVEPWEANKKRQDYFEYSWDRSDNKIHLVNLLKIYQTKDKSLDPDKGKKLPNLPKRLNTKTVDLMEPVKEYKSAVDDLHNSGENITTLNNYKESVIKLLKVQRKTDHCV